MSFLVRDGKIDVAVLAGPNLSLWPSVGVKALTSLCAEMGLSVGVYGGDDLSVKGVIPRAGTGALVIVEDPQSRIHRIEASAIVRVSKANTFSDPFKGWLSEGLILIDAAEKLLKEARFVWTPSTAILGTGNRALRFGSTLLELGCSEVFCIESRPEWDHKNYSGWEVERRRFESLGGRLVSAKPVALSKKSSAVWELRLQDAHGVRILEVNRVVSAGPFSKVVGVREYPPGSLLFEFEQTAHATELEDVEGYNLEQDRARWLATRIIRALARELGPERDRVEKINKRSKDRLKLMEKHLSEPFSPVHEGKWLRTQDLRQIRDFSGVPKAEHHLRPIASIECLESIICNACEKSCPEAAIQISRIRGQFQLNEKDCTGCGLCLPACPSRTISLVYEKGVHATSQVTLLWTSRGTWKENETAHVLNRRGDFLVGARVVKVEPIEGKLESKVTVELPTHLIWEARSLRKPPDPGSFDPNYLGSLEGTAPKVEVFIDGERRLVRDKVSVSFALYELGQVRSEDRLLCEDGSCRLCHIEIDGVKKLGCQTPVHRGMAIQLKVREAPGFQSKKDDEVLCPCREIKVEEVRTRIRQGKLKSPEAVVEATGCSRGRCHGQICAGPLKRVMEAEGIDCTYWIDWAFPWADWVLTPPSS